MEHKYISHVANCQRLRHLRAHCTLIEIYCQESILLEGYGIVAKQGIEISLQTIIFTCVKQMEKYWDRVNWLVSTEKDLLCICWAARRVSIPPTGGSRRDVYPVEITCFSLWVTAHVHAHTVEVRAAPALQPRCIPSPCLPCSHGQAAQGMPCSAPSSALAHGWSVLGVPSGKLWLCFLERGTDPNIAKAEFPTLVAS